MMDANLLAYDYDEEKLGFGEPETPVIDPPAGKSPAEKGALALVGLGLLSLIVQAAGGLPILPLSLQTEERL